MQLNHVTNSNTWFHVQEQLPVRFIRCKQTCGLNKDSCISTERFLRNLCAKSVKCKFAVCHTLHWVRTEWRHNTDTPTTNIYTSKIETKNTYLSIKSHYGIKQLHERLTVSASTNDCSVSHNGARLPVAPVI